MLTGAVVVSFADKTGIAVGETSAIFDVGLGMWVGTVEEELLAGELNCCQSTNPNIPSRIRNITIPIMVLFFSDCLSSDSSVSSSKVGFSSSMIKPFCLTQSNLLT